MNPSHDFAPGSQSHYATWQVRDDITFPPSLVRLAHKTLCITLCVVSTSRRMPLAPLVTAENDSRHVILIADDAILKGIIDEEDNTELLA